MKFSGLILAGGQSKRFGSPKGLIPHEQSNHISEWYKNFHKVGCQNIVIIVNEHNQGVYRKALEQYPDVIFLMQRNIEAPLFSSIKIGMDFIDNLYNEDGFVLTLVDVVPCKLATLKEILNVALKDEQAEVVRPQYNGKRGHPIFIKKSFYKSIIDKDEDTGRLDHILAESNSVITNVNVNDHFVTTNINEIKDLS